MPLVQDITQTELTNYDSTAINLADDKNAQRIKQVNVDVDRSFKLPISSSGVTVELPHPLVADADKVWAWDATATALVYTALASSTVNLTTGINNHGLTSREGLANSTGNTDVTPTDNGIYHTASITVSGTASTRTFAVKVANARVGDKCMLYFLNPATISIVLEVRNDTSGGTLLDTTTLDSSGDDSSVLLTFNGTAWSEAIGEAIGTYPIN